MADHALTVVPHATAFSTAWAMPTPWTFQSKPIAAFLDRWLMDAKIIVDPFCGKSDRAGMRCDLAFGMDAVQFCNELLPNVRGSADAVLFDPPYSPRQIKESYSKVGLRCSRSDTQNAKLYSRVRGQLAELLRPGGVALSFGWQSAGFCGWATDEILLVQHGGAHNDTICVAQRKPTP